MASLGLGKIEELDDEDIHKELKNKLYAINFTHPDDLDLLIADSIETGFLDEQKLERLCDAQQLEISNMEGREALTKAYTLFHNSFEDNQDEVVSALAKGLKDSAPHISTSQYSQTIELLHFLGEEQKALELTDYFIAENKDKPRKFNVDDHMFHVFEVKGEEFKRRLRDAYKEHYKEESPEDIFERYRNNDSLSYNQKDADILSKLSKNDLLDKFLKDEGDKHRNDIKTCLLLGNSNSELMKNTRDAIEEIKNKSKLQEARLWKFK